LSDKNKISDRLRFDGLYHTYKEMYFRFLSRMTGNSENAEDLLQESFVRMAQGFHQLRDEKKFRSWGFRICLNIFRMWYRKSGRKENFHEVWEDFADTRVSGTDSPEMDVFSEVLRSFLGQLNETDRSIFILNHWQQMPYPEIAETLGISPSTVKRRMQPMINRLAGMLNKSRLVAGGNCDLGGS
jgi:RNA polymerase sigma factor (sigma-70 family)